jgi:hypothetical protein
MTTQLMQDAFPEIKITLEQAQKLTQKGDFIIAEALYHELLDIEPNCPPALYGLSQLADKIDNKKLRKELLQTAIEQLKNVGGDNIKNLKASWIEELAIIDN